jgi:hypothetical protein
VTKDGGVERDDVVALPGDVNNPKAPEKLCAPRLQETRKANARLGLTKAKKAIASRATHAKLPA